MKRGTKYHSYYRDMREIFSEHLKRLIWYDISYQTFTHITKNGPFLVIWAAFLLISRYYERYLDEERDQIPLILPCYERNYLRTFKKTHMIWHNLPDFHKNHEILAISRYLSSFFYSYHGNMRGMWWREGPNTTHTTVILGKFSQNTLKDSSQKSTEVFWINF